MGMELLLESLTKLVDQLPLDDFWKNKADVSARRETEKALPMSIGTAPREVSKKQV
jgi:hypothetical protein